jgi:hypothetical protein
MAETWDYFETKRLGLIQNQNRSIGFNSGSARSRCAEVTSSSSSGSASAPGVRSRCRFSNRGSTSHQVVRSHRRFARPRNHFTPDSPRDAAPRLLRRQRGRALGAPCSSSSRSPSPATLTGTFRFFRSPSPATRRASPPAPATNVSHGGGDANCEGS